MSAWENFCEAIEKICNQQAVLAKWEMLVPDDFDSVSHLIRRTERQANSIPIENGTRLTVRRLPKGLRSGVNHDTGEQKGLCEDHLWIYELKVEELTKSLRRILGLKEIQPKFPLPARVTMVGEQKSTGGSPLPCYLIITNKPSEFSTAAKTISANSRDRFLLISPTSRFVTPETQSLLDLRRCCSITLSDAFIVSSPRNWCLSESAQQQLEAFREGRLHDPFREDAEDECGLVVDHTTFSIRYKGRVCELGYTKPFAIFDRLNRFRERTSNAFLSIQQLMDDVWSDSEFVQKNTVHKHISTLRKALQDDGLRGIKIDGDTNPGHYRLIIKDS